MNLMPSPEKANDMNSDAPIISANYVKMRDEMIFMLILKYHEI